MLDVFILIAIGALGLGIFSILFILHEIIGELQELFSLLEER